MTLNVLFGKALWFLHTPYGEATDCINWAVAALCNGQDSEHLRQLAGLGPPLNDFEVIDMTKKAISELGISLPDLYHSVSFYSRSLTEEIIEDSSKIEVNIKALFELCYQNDYREDLLNFYLLHCARESLEISKNQHYWDGADADNIDKIIVGECKKYVGCSR